MMAMLTPATSFGLLMLLAIGLTALGGYVSHRASALEAALEGIGWM